MKPAPPFPRCGQPLASTIQNFKREEIRMNNHEKALIGRLKRTPLR
ncbi:hypothetical protein FBHYGVHD_CDS0001 [Staphylococcus phage MVC_VPHSA1]|uniref:Uncharacterized protein n=1 Tax=Staphylococcus phage MVC_VPHSA1 TaxID=3088876 RepID=A0ABZ0QYD2_9CAUD|nr:hypothetical protein FBHYGVHD_CDS0001 [Staphylococcus phage MVC_VPHSA1]